MGGGVRRDPSLSLIALNQGREGRSNDGGIEGGVQKRLRDGAARNIFTSSSDFYEF